MSSSSGAVSSRASSEEPGRPNPSLLAVRPVAPRLQLAVPFCLGSVAFYDPAPDGRATHDWTCYLRTRRETDECLSTLLACVVFELHRSFGAEARAVVRRPPYAISRRGWGETCATVTLHFVDPLQPPLALSHFVRLHAPDIPPPDRASAEWVGMPKRPEPPQPQVARPDAPGDAVVAEVSDTLLFVAPTAAMVAPLSRAAAAAHRGTGRCAAWPPLPPRVWRAVLASQADPGGGGGAALLAGRAGEGAACAWLDATAAALAAESLRLRQETTALTEQLSAAAAALAAALRATKAAVEAAHPRHKRCRGE